MSAKQNSSGLRFHRVRKLARRGVMSTEYMLILALVVLPIGLLLPMMLNMVEIYGNRMLVILGLPFP